MDGEIVKGMREFRSEQLLDSDRFVVVVRSVSLAPHPDNKSNKPHAGIDIARVRSIMVDNIPWDPQFDFD